MGCHSAYDFMRQEDLAGTRQGCNSEGSKVMLVLTRRRRQSILIGDNIRITIVDAGRGNVRVGVEAPRELNVDREEVRQRTQELARAGSTVN
jgi:carbon storage regulator